MLAPRILDGCGKESIRDATLRSRQPPQPRCGRSSIAGKSSPYRAISADDLAATQRRLDDAGAKIVKPVFAFPGGRRFHFQAPDGYEFAVWSDK
jgi:catechol 2,3-dioxygenase-like lactoylglutathione lyase family enzyme